MLNMINTRLQYFPLKSSKLAPILSIAEVSFCRYRFYLDTERLVANPPEIINVSCMVKLRVAFFKSNALCISSAMFA